MSFSAAVLQHKSSMAVEGSPAKVPGTPVRSCLKAIQFQRKPFLGQFSIEGLFAELRCVMQAHGCDASPKIAPYLSKGMWRRVANIAWAWRNQGEVNHITGDVHFLALGLQPTRTVLTIHDCYLLEQLTGLKQWIYRLFWYDLPIRRSAVVTVISPETRRQLSKYVAVPQDKIVEIPDAVASCFRPCPRPFHDDCPQILHVGTWPNKNLPRLVDALEGVRCRLKIIGTLDEKTQWQLRERGVSYESATNLTKTQMYEAYCEADLVCFASTYEGFGMPIVEAQWVERPVVTSNCSSMPEVAGMGACLVDPFDVQSIRQGIVRVIRDSRYREQLIEEGRRNRERFALEMVARQYIELYERVARAASKGEQKLIEVAE